MQLLLQRVELGDLQFPLQLQQLLVLQAVQACVLQAAQHAHQHPVFHGVREDGRHQRVVGPVAVLGVGDVEIAHALQQGVVERGGDHLVHRGDQQAEADVHGDGAEQGARIEGPAAQDGIDQGTEQRPEQEVEVGHRRLPPPVEHAHLLHVLEDVVVHVGLENKERGQHPRRDEDGPVADRGAGGLKLARCTCPPQAPRDERQGVG